MHGAVPRPSLGCGTHDPTHSSSPPNVSTIPTATPRYTTPCTTATTFAHDCTHRRFHVGAGISIALRAGMSRIGLLVLLVFLGCAPTTSPTGGSSGRSSPEVTDAPPRAPTDVDTGPPPAPFPVRPSPIELENQRP